MPAEYYNRQTPRPDYARYGTRLQGGSPVVAEAEDEIWQDASAVTHLGPGRNVALLCAGPSLLETWSESMFDQFSAVVAVNGAGHNFRCHWWAASDQFHARALAAGKVARPLCGFVSTRDWGKRFKGLGLPIIHPGSIYGGAFSPEFVRANPTRDRTTYSSVAGYWQARELTPVGGVIEMFGYDASREPCVVGEKNGHHATRWKDEAIFLRELWLHGTICHGRAPAWLLEFLRGQREVCAP